MGSTLLTQLQAEGYQKQEEI